MTDTYTLYHGTSLAFATAIIGPPGTVDATRGSGEFGRGFYMTEAKGRAASWAISRSSKTLDFGIVRATFPAQKYNSLKVRALDHDKSDRLRGKCASNSVLDVDIVVGTIQYRPKDIQHKFESSDAQVLLNSAGVLSLEPT